MFLFIWLLSNLLHPTYAASYPFGNATVNFETIDSGPITTWALTDKCNKLVARSNKIYHVSDELKYESWLKGSLSSPTETINVSPGWSLNGFHVDDIESKVVIATNAWTDGGSIYNLDGSQQWISTQNYDKQYTVHAVAINGLEIIELVENFGGSGLAHLRKIDFTGSLISQITMPIDYKKMDITPDFQKALVWNSAATVKIFDLTTMTLLHTYSPPVPTPFYLTQKITFSHDSSLALLETSTINPLILINLTTFSDQNIITTTSGIHAAFFLNISLEIVVVFTNFKIYLVNITTGLICEIPKVNINNIDSYFENDFFICNNNVVSQIRITIV